MMAMNKCTSVAGHFDCCAEAMKQYMGHCPMQHVQGYSRSNWTLPSGNSLLRIVMGTTRATINETMMQNVPTLLAVSMAIAMRQYNTEHIARWRRSMAFKKATKCRHWGALAPIAQIGHTNAG